ncbi:hypothetical protein FHX06_005664 [Rhizobium sp. BK512]|nr:hypothetical protein [Rhizobium sp. BK512]
MQMDNIARMPAQRVYKITELARTLHIRDEQERKLKTLFGDFVTRQEFLANVELPPRFR